MRALADGPVPTASPAPIASPVPTGNRETGVMAGSFVILAGVTTRATTGTAGGGWAVTPDLRIRLNGMDISSNIYVDIDLNAGAPMTGAANGTRMPVTVGDLRAMFGWARGTVGCNVNIAGGFAAKIEVSPRAAEPPKTAPGAPSAPAPVEPPTVPNGTSFDFVRLEPGMLCTSGKSIVMLAPVAAFTAEIGTGGLQSMLRGGGIVRVFLNPRANGTAELTYARGVGQNGPRTIDGRVGVETVVVKDLFWGNGLTVGADVRVSQRSTESAGPTAPATSNFGMGGTVHAGFAF